LIPVEFRIEPYEDVYAHLRQWAGTMPWLQYLCNNCTDMKIRKEYDPGPYQSIVTYEFELPPKKETFYRMKYGNGL